MARCEWTGQARNKQDVESEHDALCPGGEDYFLNEDDAGIIHFEGDHKIHVVKVTHDTLSEDTRLKLDFNTAFQTGPARPHGIAMK